MNERRLVSMRSAGPGAIPPGAVYIGRRTILGNPFRIGPDGNREEVVEKYREYFQRRLREQGFVDRVLDYIGTSDLACWCPPKPCHGEVILAWLSSIEQAP